MCPHTVTLPLTQNKLLNIILRKGSGTTRPGRRGPSVPELLPTAMNKEWHHMFGGVESGGAIIRTSDFQNHSGYEKLSTF